MIVAPAPGMIALAPEVLMAVGAVYTYRIAGRELVPAVVVLTAASSQAQHQESRHTRRTQKTRSPSD